MTAEDIAVEYSPDDIEPETEAERILHRNEVKLREITDVVGVGLGQNSIGDPAIVVYTRHQDVGKTLPKTVEGLDMMVEVVGDINIQTK